MGDSVAEDSGGDGSRWSRGRAPCGVVCTWGRVWQASRQLGHDWSAVILTLLFLGSTGCSIAGGQRSQRGGTRS